MEYRQETWAAIMNRIVGRTSMRKPYNVPRIYTMPAPLPAQGKSLLHCSQS